jgi:hypothetical protein
VALKDDLSDSTPSIIYEDSVQKEFSVITSINMLFSKISSFLLPDEIEALTSLIASVSARTSPDHPEHNFYKEKLEYIINTILIEQGADFIHLKGFNSSRGAVEDQLFPLIQNPYIRAYIGYHSMIFGRGISNLARLSLVSQLPVNMFTAWEELAGETLAAYPLAYPPLLRSNPDYRKILSYNFLRATLASTAKRDPLGYEELVNLFIKEESNNLIERVDIASRSYELISKSQCFTNRFKESLPRLINELRIKWDLVNVPDSWIIELAEIKIGDK